VVVVEVAEEVVVLVLVDGVGVGVFVPPVPAVPAVADIVDNDGMVPMFITVQQLPTSSLLYYNKMRKERT
jgi:hypothetical protein